MAIKLQVMRALCFPRRHLVPVGEFPDHSPSPASLSATLMEDTLDSAEQEVYRWNSSSPVSMTRDDVHDLVLAADGLQRVMDFFAADSRSRNLVRAQKLMQSAMQHLEREFYRILSANRNLAGEITSRSRPSSDADEDKAEGECGPSAVTDDLREIAETMVSAGYGKECVRAYKMVRTSVVDEGLYLLRFEHLPAAQIDRMDWEALEIRIKAWLGTAPAAVALFASERSLADQIFASYDSIREALFADVIRTAAADFLAFPELAARAKRSPEKLFRLLDMHDAISSLWPEIASVFSYKAMSAVPAQAAASLLRLAEAARGTIAELEAAIQKETDAGKKTVPGGGIHPLTRYVMNYITFLADYESALEDIYAGSPLGDRPSLPDAFFIAEQGSEATAATVRLAWLMLVLLCKLDGKAEAYNDVALSYLFLANNLQYVVKKVTGRGGEGLRALIGDEWATLHAAKARKYAGNYERLAWGRVAAAVPAAEGVADADEAATRARVFAGVLDEACRMQREWVVADAGMREEIRDSVEDMILPAYRVYWDRCQEYLRCAAGTGVVAPEEVRERLSEFFAAPSGSDSNTTGSVSGLRFGYGCGTGFGSSKPPSPSP